MRAYVTGASGFIGSHLVRELVRLGHQVFVNPSSRGENELPASVQAVQGVPSVDKVYHLGAITDTTCQDLELLHQVNVRWSAELFRDASRLRIPVVYASSASVYGNLGCNLVETVTARLSSPINLYAWSKLACEAAALAWGSRIVGLRFTNVYGSGESHKGRAASYLWQLREQMKTGSVRLFRDGCQRRDWVHVSDVVSALVLAGEQGEGVINIGTGRGTDFLDLVRLLGWTGPIEWVDQPANYQRDNVVDISKARSVLGWTPRVSLAEGIAELRA